VHRSRELVEETGKLRADLDELGRLAQRRHALHVRRERGIRPGGDVLVWQIVRAHAPPDRLYGLMQSRRLTTRFLIRLPRDARHVHAQGPRDRADQRRRGGDRPGLHLGEKAVGHVRPLGQFTGREASRFTERGNARPGPILVKHKKHLPPATFKRFEISRAPFASMLLYSDHATQPEASMSENPSLTAADIEAAYIGRWAVWLSDTGQWWAARTQPLTAGQLAAGCVPFLRAVAPDELKQAISCEERPTNPNEGP
jgi:hypothetical protein